MSRYTSDMGSIAESPSDDGVNIDESEEESEELLLLEGKLEESYSACTRCASASEKIDMT